MSLHVNLLMESERRSSRILSPKLMLRVVVIAIPLFAAAAVLSGVGKTMIMTRELRQLETAWRSAEPQKKKAEKLSVETAYDRHIVKEITGWKNSRIDWHKQMETVQGVVPPAIQIVSLTVEQTLDSAEDKRPTRTYTMSLRGKARGTESEEAVKGLRTGLQRAETSTGTVEKVQVVTYGAETGQNAGTNDYVFQIDCIYHVKVFE